MVFVSISRSLDSDHRPSVQSVPLGLFYPESKALDCSWLGRSREGGWHLLSRLVVWFLWMCGWVVTGLVLRWRSWGLVTWCHQLHERDWVAVCCLQTLHLTHSAELWPRFLRFALWGCWAPRVHAWSPAHGQWGPRPGHSLPWRVADPVGETGAEFLEIWI